MAGRDSSTPPDYHAHCAHGGGGYLCCERRADWPSVVSDARRVGMIPCLGVHPWHASREDPADVGSALSRWLKEYPDAQVGESGLDGKTAAREGWEAQSALLDAHAEAAFVHGRLLQLHSAGAHGRLLGWAAERARCGRLPRIHLHAWNGSPEMARSWLRLGATFSAGVREWQSPRAAVRYAALPAESLFPESDADADSWPESLRLWQEWQKAAASPPNG